MRSMERAANKIRLSGDEALGIIGDHRKSVNDHFRTEELEREFPSYARRLGTGVVHLANAADNTVGAYKWRGAYAGAAALKKRGAYSVVTPSAGNALRGGAAAANSLDLDYHGVVSRRAPRVKREGSRQLYPGPRFRLHVVGDSFDESLGWALEHPELGALLHPFDDPNVAAGQGTLADDILDSPLGRDTKHIVVPVGGGGLTAGLLRRLDEIGRDDIAVHAVEAEGSNSLSRSLEAGEVTDATAPNARYGGSAVRRIGRHTLDVCRSASNLHIHSVMDSEVEAVTEEYAQDRYDLWRLDTPNFEPTALVAIAGIRQVVEQHPDEHIVVIGTGYNDSLWPA